MSDLSALELKRLTKFATRARDNAYCPYSNHPVGAALMTAGGKVYTGCNVENAHFNCTHAEASAISTMIADGEREISAIVVVGPAMEYLCTPCGDCRQRLREFAGKNLRVYSMWKDGSFGMVNSLGELLPHSFGPENLAEVGRGPKKMKKKKK